MFNHDVHFQIAFGRRTVSAKFTFKWSLARVCTNVSLHSVTIVLVISTFETNIQMRTVWSGHIRTSLTMTKNEISIHR
jgi:hypothetical protein